MHNEIWSENPLANRRLEFFAHSCVYSMLHYKLTRNCRVGSYSIITSPYFCLLTWTDRQKYLTPFLNKRTDRYDHLLSNFVIKKYYIFSWLMMHQPHCLLCSFCSSSPASWPSGPLYLWLTPSQLQHSLTGGLFMTGECFERFLIIQIPLLISNSITHFVCQSVMLWEKCDFLFCCLR